MRKIFFVGDTRSPFIRADIDFLKESNEVLFVFDTPEEMYAKEAELVNEEFLLNENTYNLKQGGFGG